MFLHTFLRLLFKVMTTNTGRFAAALDFLRILTELFDIVVFAIMPQKIVTSPAVRALMTISCKLDLN